MSHDLDFKIKSNNTTIKNKEEDIVNNNHIEVLESKTKQICLNKDNDCFLFDGSLFADLNPKEFLFNYETNFQIVSNTVDLGDGLILRPLKRDDFKRGYITLLSQLTEMGNIKREDFEKRFDKMKAAADTYYIFVVEDERKGKIVASLTLVYEQKFIRQTSARGRVEDVVVDVDYRGKKLSKLLLDISLLIGKRLGCYKISLECKDPLRKLYEQFGFQLESGQNYLCRRFI